MGQLKSRESLMIEDIIQSRQMFKDEDVYDDAMDLTEENEAKAHKSTI